MTTIRVLVFWVLTVCILIMASAVFPTQEIFSIGLAGVLTMLLTAAFARWDRKPLADMGVVPGAGSIARFGTGLLVGVGLVLFQELAIGLSGVASLTFREAVPAAITGKLALYGLVAWREELAFRGYPLRRLADANGPVYAILVLMLLFSLEHFWGGMNWWQALFGVGIGACLFGIMAYRTGGIAMPLGMHLMWNFGQWSFGQKGGGGIWHWDILPEKEGIAELWGYAAYFLAYGVAILLFWKIPRRR